MHNKYSFSTVCCELVPWNFKMFSIVSQSMRHSFVSTIDALVHFVKGTSIKEAMCILNSYCVINSGEETCYWFHYVLKLEATQRSTPQTFRTISWGKVNTKKNEIEEIYNWYKSKKKTNQRWNYQLERTFNAFYKWIHILFDTGFVLCVGKKFLINMEGEQN